HATDIWNNPKYRDDWGLTDRLAFLKAMMALPRRIGIPICMGMVRRECQALNIAGMTVGQSHHFQGFWNCVACEDKFIRDHAGLREVATVVAEDVPEMRKYLRTIPKMLRNNPHVMPPGGNLRPTLREQAQGYIQQEGDFRVTRIRDTVHFVEKEDDPLLQL